MLFPPVTIVRAYLTPQQCDSTDSVKAFCAFVRPVLEFSSEIWNPYFKTDIKKIENVQRRFTKAIFPKLSYSERLLRLHLPTLEM